MKHRQSHTRKNANPPANPPARRRLSGGAGEEPAGVLAATEPAAGPARARIAARRRVAAARAHVLTLAVTAAAMLIVTSTATSDTARLSVCASGCQYKTIQAAVDAAGSGDTITVGAGTYVEGTGLPDSSSLTIDKSLTIEGAGAVLVTIEPAPGTIANNRTDGNGPTRYDALGNVVAISSPDPANPIRVAISGVTVNGEAAHSTVDSGVAFTDATGSLTNSVVTNIDQYKTGIQVGIGVTVYSDQSSGALLVTLTGDEINGYGKGGVYLEGTGQPAGSGVVATISQTTVTSAGSHAALNALFIGDGASASVTDSTVSGN
jgi:pectin methylesterase-like acyl-CoA thioesterase